MIPHVALKEQKILIAGPTSQVAAPVIDALRTDNTLYAIARFSDEAQRLALEAKGVHCLRADLATDDLAALIPDDIDYVLNYAVVKSGDFAYDLKVNAEGAGRLIAACRGVKAFVHFSSTAVYEYAKGELCREDSALGDNHRAMFPTYSISKIAAESVVRFAAETFEVPVVIARLSVPYGDNGGWPLFHLQMMQAGVQIDIHPDRPNAYNLLHSCDYIEKIPALLASASPQAVTVNFGGSVATSVEEWCGYLTEISGFEPIFNETPAAFGTLAIDTEKMHELLGPTRVDWREGILSMIQKMAPGLLKPAYRP
ncbi:nucleoside-diphosphate-sugar epimerase [Sinobacterium caligoides]|uniref:Nucleoside-diphosphate-sugar epimerase n=1 Tax=Sinobacterium caligoides TaxID=933926 RepID=A0A3N2D513_9GAMM|nr:NAD(P)-dependent oxidoreductase [Sinobacterium caligoides]ROR94762.1 nucleoside-diphosphate-sugar epimerase [Sinobacterium caligoides]